jgi:hypothetical protein
MKHRALSIAILAAAAVLGPATAPAYYHFITYLKSGNAPQKFDLTALPGKTVAFFVSESGPLTYTPPDTFNSVLMGFPPPISGSCSEASKTPLPRRTLQVAT